MIKQLKKFCTYLLLSTIVGTFALAGTQKLAYITNQEDKDIIDLVLVTDHMKDATHLKMIHKHSNGKVYHTGLFTARKVESGVVIYEKKGREIVKLKSRNFSKHQGGDVSLDYLVSGVTGRRDNLTLNLSRDGDKWSLKTNRSLIKKMHFVSNKKAFIGTIGIKRIEAK